MIARWLWVAGCPRFVVRPTVRLTTDLVLNKKHPQQPAAMTHSRPPPGTLPPRPSQFGDFTLASGKKSSYYVNSKKVLFHAEAIALLGELLYEATKDLDFQAIGGLEVGAIPMAAPALTAFHRHGRTLEGFFVRKKAKEHGSQERLEGQVKPGTGWW